MSETIVVSSPVADASDVPQSVREPAKNKREADAERAATRLRRAGYSYRRIAETLSIPYITISRWLSGDTSSPVPTAPKPKPFRADPRDLVPASEIAARQAAVAALAPPQDVIETGEVSHRLEVLQLQFASFEKYARDMAEEFNTSRKELLAEQAEAVKDMARERDAIHLTRKSFEAAIQRFDSKFDDLANELRGELETLKDHVRQQLEKIKADVTGGAASSAPARIAKKPAREEEPEEDDPFGGGDDEDPFASSGDDDDDPFGSSNDDEDPFADKGEDTKSAEADDEDPFATDDDDEDPFADKGEDTKSAKADDEDPFATDDDDEDPFADKGEDTKSAKSDDDDPFAAKEDDDPFATEDDDDPFAEKPSR
jgi:flagellar biosynthesis regulator FlaF